MQEIHEKDEIQGFLYFKFVTNTGKTSVWNVINPVVKIKLGEIKWHGPWRKYVFATSLDSIFDTSCLNSISVFIANQMYIRTIK